MSTQPARRRVPAGGILAILGGALIVAASFFQWWKLTVQDSFRSLEGDTVVLIAGIAVAVLGLLLAFMASRGARIAISILIVLAALLAILFSGIYLIGDDAVIATAADSFAEDIPGSTAEALEEQLIQLKAEGQVTIERSLGLYLALAGGVLSLIGGILGFRRGPVEPVTPPPPAPGYAAGTPTATQPVAPTTPPPPPTTPPPPPGGTTGGYSG